MLCESHQNQEHIAEPEKQFAQHLDLGSILLEKQSFAEAEDHFRCAFTLYENGLVPEDPSVVRCFARLMEALDAQQKQSLISAYLEKGASINFERIYSERPVLKLVRSGQSQPTEKDSLPDTKFSKWVKEAGRLNALRRYEILDTPPDGCFERLTALASKIFNMPIVIISLVDTDRIWFKSHHGLEGVEQIGRDPGLCASAILSDEVYLVEDARSDPRCLANPLVCGDFGLQFYAAAPLKTYDGHNLGTFCVLDKKQRYLNTDQDKLLVDLAAIAMDEIEVRLAARNVVKASNRRVAELENRLKALGA